MRDRIYVGSLVVLIGLGLLSFGYLGSFTRLIGDDFQIAIIGIQHGAFGGMLERYQNWSGLYTNFFIKSAIAPYQITLQPFITGTIIALWLPALWWCFAELGHWLGWRNPRQFALWCAGLLGFTLLNGLSGRQPLYWFAAQIPYLFPIVPLTLWAALLLWLLRAERSRWQIIGGGSGAALLMFLIGGFAEGGTTGQIAFIGLAWLAANYMNWRNANSTAQRAGWLLLFSGIASVLALGVVLLAPGNAARFAFTDLAAAYSAPPLPELLMLILWYAAQYFWLDLYGIANMGFIALATTALFFWWYRNQPHELKALPLPRNLALGLLLGLGVTYSLIVSIIAPPMYGAGVPGPRTLTLARWAQLGLMLFVGYSATVWLARHIPTHYWRRRLVYRLVKWAVMALLLFMPLAVLGMHLSLAPRFAQYAQGWDKRHAYIQAQIAQGATEAVVPPLAYDLEDYIDLEILGTRSDPNWINDAYYDYYRLRVYTAEATP
jgi:hypothetical protein